MLIPVVNILLAWARRAPLEPSSETRGHLCPLTGKGAAMGSVLLPGKEGIPVLEWGLVSPGRWFSCETDQVSLCLMFDWMGKPNMEKQNTFCISGEAFVLWNVTWGEIKKFRTARIFCFSFDFFLLRSVFRGLGWEICWGVVLVRYGVLMSKPYFK